VVLHVFQQVIFILFLLYVQIRVKKFRLESKFLLLVLLIFAKCDIFLWLSFVELLCGRVEHEFKILVGTVDLLDALHGLERPEN